MSDLSPMSRNNSETKSGYLNSEQMEILANNWLNSFKMISHNLGSKMVPEKIEDIEAHLEKELNTLLDKGYTDPYTDQLIARFRNILTTPHRKGIIAGISAFIKDDDKIVVISLYNEESVQPIGLETLMSIEFYYVTPTNDIDKKIHLVDIYSNIRDSYSVGIYDKDFEILTNLHYANIVSEMLQRFANDTELGDKALSPTEASKIINQVK
jgi:hypothetical protein